MGVLGETAMGYFGHPAGRRPQFSQFFHRISSFCGVQQKRLPVWEHVET